MSKIKAVIQQIVTETKKQFKTATDPVKKHKWKIMRDEFKELVDKL